MKLRVLIFTLFAYAAGTGFLAYAKNHCGMSGPSRVWIVDNPYPFQLGAEATFDELYHGPWKAEVDIKLFKQPGSGRVVGQVRKGTIVDALVAESRVIHPLRITAAQNFQVGVDSANGQYHVKTLPKGDVFWVLNVGGEGEFAACWRGQVVRWDSTEATEGDLSQLDKLGTNEQSWVKIRDPATGLSGWFRQDTSPDPILLPANPTTKRIG